MIKTDPIKAVSDVIPNGYQIKAGGIFNLQELYAELQRWFIHYGYDWKEIKYRNVDQPGGGKQVEIMWACEQEVDDYVTWVIKTHIQTFMSDTEIPVEGGKKKVNNGSIEFRFHAYMKKNIEIWDKHWWGNLGKVIYEKILAKQRLGDYEDQLYGDAQNLFSEIKAHLQLYQ